MLYDNVDTRESRRRRRGESVVFQDSIMAVHHIPPTPIAGNPTYRRPLINFTAIHRS